jgi:hypothetical protein
MRIAIEEIDGPHPFAELGVWAVPTRVFANGLSVTNLRVGGDLLTVDSIRSLCRTLSR